MWKTGEKLWAKWWFECRVSKVDVFENVLENIVVKIDKDPLCNFIFNPW